MYLIFFFFLTVVKTWGYKIVKFIVTTLFLSIVKYALCYFCAAEYLWICFCDFTKPSGHIINIQYSTGFVCQSRDGCHHNPAIHNTIVNRQVFALSFVSDKTVICLAKQCDVIFKIRLISLHRAIKWKRNVRRPVVRGLVARRIFYFFFQFFFFGFFYTRKFHLSKVYGWQFHAEELGRLLHRKKKLARIGRFTRSSAIHRRRWRIRENENENDKEKKYKR